MALEEAIAILAVLMPIANAIPVLGAPVQSSLETLSKILDFAQGVKSNKEKAQELAVQAARWLKTIVDVLLELELKANHAELEGLRPNMEDILNVLKPIMQFTEHCAKQGPMARTMHKFRDEKELTRLRETMEEAFKRFKLESHIRIEKALHTLLTAAETEALKGLKPVFSARFDSRDSPDGCLVDTREDILRSMISWVTEPSSPSSSMSIFWLADLAGTGKSTVIKTFCQRVDSDDRFLLVSFFASRNSAERRDPYAILHTFAYELAISTNCFRTHILSAVRAPQDITQRPMWEQVDQLLAEPIKKAQLRGRTIVFAIDALDECQKSAGVEGGPLITLLAQALRHQPVKLIITSRQEDSLTQLFRSLPHASLRLHEVGSALVEADVRRVLNEGFAMIRRVHAGSLEAGEWPTRSQLNGLVSLTGPFFIYAATVLKFIGDSRFSPDERLNQVLKRGSAISLVNSKPFSQIDILYADVLKSVTADATGCADAELCRRVGDLLRTVVLLEEPVSIRALSHLMGAFDDVQQVDKDVRALGSVLLISYNSGPDRFSDTVSMFHPSFRDFLVDPHRCLDEQFLVRPAEHQHKLLFHCIELLNNKLCYDICGIRSPGRANAEVKDLPVLLARHVPEAVVYASQFWPVHLVANGSPSDSVLTALLEFCVNHLFHWLETLSLLGKLSSAGEHLPRIIAWCQSHMTVSPSIQEIILLLVDAHYAMRAYATPIVSHALQVYHSVLATGPRCKLLNSMRDGHIGVPCLISQRASDWSSVLQVIEGLSHAVNSVACSHDGAHIVSGSSDTSVRVWDARTCKELVTIKGHNSSVRSVAFSPDGAHVASGSGDKTVRVWDVGTGKQLAVFKGHSGPVWSVAYSPDGQCIVSGSQDKTVRAWDARTGRNIALLEGHSDRVWSVAFSPSGEYIVSGSEDETVRVWDARTSKQLVMIEGHSGYVLSVAFSPDSAHIISGSDDETVRMWDARTGKQLAILKGHSNRVVSVAFSPDGAHIVSSSDDMSVRVWDARTATKLAVLKGHTGSVRSAIYSSDGAHIISGSEDKTLRVWNATRAGTHLAVREGHSSWVWSLAFSPDGAHIISGSQDTTIQVWDARTGKQLAVLQGHSGPVWSVAFLYNGVHIVTGSEDMTVRVWDAQAGNQLAVLRGHRSSVWSVAFAPDGAHIVSGSQDMTVRVWDTRSGKQVTLLEGHSGWVRTVAFSPDGTHIVSGSNDKTVRVWDTRTATQVAILEGHGDWVRSAAFSLDGKHIVSSDCHGRELVWEIKDVRAGIMVSGPISLITALSHTHVNTLVWNHETGWISWERLDGSCPLHLCWLPVERRGESFACYNTTVAIGARQGAVTILDFSDIISMLKGLDQAPYK